MFSLFVDDSTSNAAIYGQDGAFITINNQSLTAFPIVLNCQKTFKVNKIMNKINGVQYTGGEIRLWAGESFTVSFVSMEGSQEVKANPMDVSVIDGGTVLTSNRLESSASRASEITYIFDQGVQKAGTHLLIYSSSSSDVSIKYALTVEPLLTLNTKMSTFEVLYKNSSSIAGEATQVVIYPKDKFGNPLKSNFKPEDFVVKYNKLKMDLGFSNGRTRSDIEPTI